MLVLRDWIAALRQTYINDQAVLLWGYAAAAFLTARRGWVPPVMLEFEEGAGTADAAAILVTAQATPSPASRPPTGKHPGAIWMKSDQRERLQTYVVLSPGEFPEVRDAPTCLLVRRPGANIDALHQMAPAAAAALRRIGLSPEVMERMDDLLTPCTIHAGTHGFPGAAAVGASWAAVVACSSPETVGWQELVGIQWCIPTAPIHVRAADAFLMVCFRHHRKFHLWQQDKWSGDYGLSIDGVLEEEGIARKLHSPELKILKRRIKEGLKVLPGIRPVYEHPREGLVTFTVEE